MRLPKEHVPGCEPLELPPCPSWDVQLSQRSRASTDVPPVVLRFPLHRVFSSGSTVLGHEPVAATAVGSSVGVKLG